MGGTTIGTYINEDEEDLIKAFDRLHNTGDDTYSRSEHVKEAMRLANMVAKTQQHISDEYDYAYDQMEGYTLRHWIKQCMLDKARREADGE